MRALGLVALCRVRGERTGGSKEQAEGFQQLSTQEESGDSGDGVTDEGAGGSGGSQEEGSGSYEGRLSNNLLCTFMETFHLP